MPVKNYYQILGIPNFASDEEAKRAYRQLMLKHHPDANPDTASHSDTTRLLNEIKSVLSNPETKAEYDAQLRYFLEPHLHTAPSNFEFNAANRNDTDAPNNYWDIGPNSETEHLLNEDEIQKEIKFRKRMETIAVSVLVLFVLWLIIGFIVTSW